MSQFVCKDEIRLKFSQAMSDMYQTEVPLFGDLLKLVNDVNAKVLEEDPELKQKLQETGELERLEQTRHGAIRIGKKEELHTMRRIFAVMGMYPVAYYDLAPAGIPVHSTAFRPIDPESLIKCPFRVFCSLLRLELIDDADLRKQAEEILAKRNIFSPRAIELVEKFEKDGGLGQADADEFVKEVLETFRWQSEAAVSKETYDALHNQHRLIADIVAFKVPHINHLTPRALDIDAVQKGMFERGIPAKDIIEGPPRRECLILLRQTSFKALNEDVQFVNGEERVPGSHTARFGEIEKRGVALTPKGRKLYDELLAKVLDETANVDMSKDAESYYAVLKKYFDEIPDCYGQLHEQGLAYFRYKLADGATLDKEVTEENASELVASGVLKLEPITYEDFLPVSAAGIFRSNLGGAEKREYDEASNRALFEQNLGDSVLDPFEIYSKIQKDSIDALNKKA